MCKKIKKFKTFYNEVSQRNQDIEKLSKENKNLYNKNNNLENKNIQYLNSTGQENDIDDIYLKIKKLEEDSLYKDEAIKNYEDMFK